MGRERGLCCYVVILFLIPSSQLFSSLSYNQNHMCVDLNLCFIPYSFQFFRLFLFLFPILFPSSSPPHTVSSHFSNPCVCVFFFHFTSSFRSLLIFPSCFLSLLLPCSFSFSLFDFLYSLIFFPSCFISYLAIFFLSAVFCYIFAISSSASSHFFFTALLSSSFLFPLLCLCLHLLFRCLGHFVSFQRLTAPPALSASLSLR